MATKKVLEVYQGFEITKGMGFHPTGFTAKYEETTFSCAKKADLKGQIDDYWERNGGNGEKPPIVKKLVFQVNLQPTWVRILPLLIDQIERDQGSAVYENAKKELFNMAQVADYYADRAKTDANVVSIIELLLNNTTEEFKQRQPEAVRDILELIANFKEEGDDDGK